MVVLYDAFGGGSSALSFDFEDAAKVADLAVLAGRRSAAMAESDKQAFRCADAVLEYSTAQFMMSPAQVSI